jgi:hypothetical protein
MDEKQWSEVSGQLSVDVSPLSNLMLKANREVIMKSETAQWILWAVAMVIFTALTLSGHWNWLGAAITVVGVIWYTVVPKAHSRRQ